MSSAMASVVVKYDHALHHADIALHSTNLYSNGKLCDVEPTDSDTKPSLTMSRKQHFTNNREM